MFENIYQVQRDPIHKENTLAKEWVSTFTVYNYYKNEMASLSLETNKYILLVYTVNHIPKDLIIIIITFSMTLTKPIIYQSY